MSTKNFSALAGILTVGPTSGEPAYTIQHGVVDVSSSNPPRMTSPANCCVGVPVIVEATEDRNSLSGAGGTGEAVYDCGGVGADGVGVLEEESGDGLEVLVAAKVVDEVGEGEIRGTEATVADEVAEEGDGGAAEAEGGEEDLAEERSSEADVGEVKGDVEVVVDRVAGEFSKDGGDGLEKGLMEKNIQNLGTLTFPRE